MWKIRKLLLSTKNLCGKLSKIRIKYKSINIGELYDKHKRNMEHDTEVY